MNTLDSILFLLSFNDNKKMSILEAAKNGDVEIIKLLINEGNDVNVNDEGGETPLHWTVYRRHRNS